MSKTCLTISIRPWLKRISEPPASSRKAVRPCDDPVLFAQWKTRVVFSGLRHCVRSDAGAAGQQAQRFSSIPAFQQTAGDDLRLNFGCTLENIENTCIT